MTTSTLQGQASPALSSKKLIHKKLLWGICINAIFTLFECGAALYSGSLALLSDAAQNLNDILSIIICFIAYKIAQRPATTTKSFGYGRATILAAFCNACILIISAASIFYKAYERYGEADAIEGSIVMLVGFCGILVNGGVALMFLKYRHDINIKGTFLNMIFDAIASAGALIAGIIILLTGWTAVDSLISVFIGILLLISAAKMIYEVVHILCEGSPQHIDIKSVKQIISNHPAIINIQKLHVWTISSEQHALAAVLAVADNNVLSVLGSLERIKTDLHTHYGISHSTFEITIFQNR